MMEFKLYTRRWYILALTCFILFYGSYVPNQWGVIYKSLEKIYGWRSTQVALLPFYGSAMFPFLVLPSVWILERYGLRISMLLLVGTMLAGTAVRCIPGSNFVETVLINVGSVIMGAAMVIGSYIPVHVTAYWFGPHERTFATSLGNLAGISGNALSFLISPRAVPSDAPAATEKHDLHIYIYAEAGLSLLLFLLVLIYYPSHPPTPSSATASVERQRFLPGIRTLVKSPIFYRTCGPVIFLLSGMSLYTISLGFVLGAVGIDDSETGLLGAAGIFSGLALGVVVAKLCDVLRTTKPFVVALAVMAAEGMVWFLLMYAKLLPVTLAQMWFATILTNGCVTPVITIAIEIAADANYPVPEAVTISLIQMVNSVIGAVTLIFMTFVGTQNHEWIVIFFTVLVVAGVISCMFVPSTYSRSQEDNKDLHQSSNKGKTENGLALATFHETIKAHGDDLKY